MMKIVLTVCCCLLVAPLGADTSASESVELLALGESTTTSVVEGATNSHWVDLEDGQFIYAEVYQHDIDVKITVYDPNEKVVGLFDSSARGADPIHLDTEVAGRFRIDIVPFEDDEAGSYTLDLQRVEPVATVPQKRLEQLLARFTGNDVPGAVVAVIHNGEVAHSQAVGVANMTYGIPFTRETVSNIGSVSKQFTAFAVTKLAQDGELSLDDDVRMHFPELPDLGKTVTVRDLLRHTSGYREFLNLLAMSGRRLEKGDYIDRDEILTVLERQTELQDEPGTRFNYNNTAYSLASLLVEKITGVPFPQWLEDNLFAPLGMKHTRVRGSTGEIVPNAAEGYLPGDEVPFRLAVDLGGGGEATLGPGGVYTTVDDLALWMGNLRTGEIGGEDVITEMTSPQIEEPGEGKHYGLGLSLEHHRGLELIQHGGADTAHRAMLLYYPEIDSGVVAMSNHSYFPASTIARKTAEAFFGAHMEPEEMTETEESTETSADTGADTDFGAELFEPYAGKYELVDYPGIVFEISVVDGQVMLAPPGEDPLPVSPISATSLSIPPDESLEFHPNDDGDVESLTYHSTTDLSAKRLADWSPTEEDLTDYLGRYFSEELATFYTVEEGEEGLIITHERLDDIELTPKVEDSFNCSDVLAEVTFKRDDAGTVEGLVAGNVRTQNVWFERID